MFWDHKFTTVLMVMILLYTVTTPHIITIKVTKLPYCPVLLPSYFIISLHIKFLFHSFCLVGAIYSSPNLCPILPSRSGILSLGFCEVK